MCHFVVILLVWATIVARYDDSVFLWNSFDLNTSVFL